MSDDLRREEDLTSEEMDYYSRQIVLDSIDYDGQLRLRNARACVVGMGGLGSTIAMQLASVGVGMIRLIDRDVVERSNLHRQQIYGYDDLGYPKVERAAQRLRRLNPFISIDPRPVSIHDGNAVQQLRGVDIVVDGLDAVEPRYAVNRACHELGIPYVHGAAIKEYGSVMTIIPGMTACLECLLGEVSDEEMLTCAVAGIHPSVLGLVASVEASEAIRYLVSGEVRLAGMLLFLDLKNLEFDKIPVSKGISCQVCGPVPGRKGKREMVRELCGREGRSTFIITPEEGLEVSMKALRMLLDREEVEYVAKGEMGTTFDQAGRRISLLTSGVMIAEGFPDGKEALRAYTRIIESLGLLDESIGGRGDVD